MQHTSYDERRSRADDTFTPSYRLRSTTMSGHSASEDNTLQEPAAITLSSGTQKNQLPIEETYNFTDYMTKPLKKSRNPGGANKESTAQANNTMHQQSSMRYALGDGTARVFDPENSMRPKRAAPPTRGEQQKKPMVQFVYSSGNPLLNHEMSTTTVQTFSQYAREQTAKKYEAMMPERRQSAINQSLDVMAWPSSTLPEQEPIDGAVATQSHAEVNQLRNANDAAAYQQSTNSEGAFNQPNRYHEGPAQSRASPTRQYKVDKFAQVQNISSIGMPTRARRWPLAGYRPSKMLGELQATIQKAKAPSPTLQADRQQAGANTHGQTLQSMLDHPFHNVALPWSPIPGSTDEEVSMADPLDPNDDDLDYDLREYLTQSMDPAPDRRSMSNQEALHYHRIKLMTEQQSETMQRQQREGQSPYDPATKKPEMSPEESRLAADQKRLVMHRQQQFVQELQRKSQSAQELRRQQPLPQEEQRRVKPAPVHTHFSNIPPSPGFEYNPSHQAPTQHYPLQEMTGMGETLCQRDQQQLAKQTQMWPQREMQGWPPSLGQKGVQFFYRANTQTQELDQPKPQEAARAETQESAAAQAERRANGYWAPFHMILDVMTPETIAEVEQALLQLSQNLKAVRPMKEVLMGREIDSRIWKAVRDVRATQTEAGRIVRMEGDAPVETDGSGNTVKHEYIKVQIKTEEGNGVDEHFQTAGSIVTTHDMSPATESCDDSWDMLLTTPDETEERMMGK